MIQLVYIQKWRILQEMRSWSMEDASPTTTESVSWERNFYLEVSVTQGLN